MSRGVSHVVVCEDQEQQSLIRKYMKRCVINTSRDVRFMDIPSRIGISTKDSGTKRVRENFVRDLKACRAKQAAGQNVLLVVMIDADKEEWDFSTRRAQLEVALGDDGPLEPSDPFVLFVPKRNVETWIQAALGATVNEVEDYKKQGFARLDIRRAALQIFDWARNNAVPGATCLDSLRKALPDWHRIG